MLKFGLYIRSGETYPGFLDLARLAEELGLFGVFLNDHVHGFANDGKEPYLESWTAMTGIGVQTNRIRLSIASSVAAVHCARKRSGPHTCRQ